MSSKGRSDPNLFGGYTHYDKKGHKTVQVRQASSVAMLIMTARDIRSGTLILAYLAAIIIMTIMGANWQ